MFSTAGAVWGRRGRYRTGASVSQDGNNLVVIVPDMSEQDRVQKDISPAEWVLLDGLDCEESGQLHAGPFLTVQRRRRRRKYVRTYLFKDPTLIDDLSAYQTNFVLDRISKWAFNAFILDNVTGGRPLPNLCVHLFKSYGLLEHFNLDPVIVWKLFSIIEDGYHWRNPYHNAVHAADVTQAMHCFLQETRILEKLTPLEIFSAIVAAVVHDLDHPGVNQPFLIATSNHLAALYKNSSVLENHHWRSAMGCLNESGVTDVLGPERVAEVEEQIRSLVLATDITRQQEFLTRLREYLDTDTLDMDKPEVRHFVLQIALKCADISNPCRPWDVSRKWSMKVCEEFFRQGDYERQLNLPVTPLCDRYTSSVPKIQAGFFQFIVRPLVEEWHRMMATQLSNYMMHNLDTNKKKWDQLLEEEEASKTLLRNTEEILLLRDSDSRVKPATTPIRETVEPEREGSSRSVRFDTTITTASDSDNSDADDGAHGKPAPRVVEFLGIPRPDGRRHSIATGLMGDNMQFSPQKLMHMSGELGSGSLLNISDLVGGEPSLGKVVGRTVIRRESLPGGGLFVGKNLSSKTILHLQKISAKAEAAGAGATSPGGFSPGDTADLLASIPGSPIRIHTERSSCSSTSTTDEIMDFPYTLPDIPRRSTGSPRRLLHDTPDYDELCPGTSILSMSNRVAHVTLQQGADVEEQRRHLIRQQTCPVVSLNADGSFNRPRFLSAAAAISPTAVASSSIITQHRMRNRSPESGGEGDAPSLGSGRGSGGSSNEALKCEVISEEADRASSGSSAEASPLEIFVQQFPPISDDNDGEAPRRGSGSLDPSDFTGLVMSHNPSTASSNLDPSPDTNSETRQLPSDDQPCKTESENRPFKLELSVSCQSQPCDSREEVCIQPEIMTSVTSTRDRPQLSRDPDTASTYDSSTQTDCPSGKENVAPTDRSKGPSSQPNLGPTSSVIAPTISMNPVPASRLATILMWRNNRLWKSLTEEEHEEGPCVLNLDPTDQQALADYFEQWDVRVSQQTHQGVVGGRLQMRRGSAPTPSPAMGCRGAQDRRSDPTQYHSSSCLTTNVNFGTLPMPETLNYGNSNKQVRRGSVPVDLLRQSTLRSVAPNNNKKQIAPRAGRRGSLPIDPSAGSEPPFAYKWMHVFPYNEDDDASLKRRSSGGPELFAAAQTSTWKAQILIDHLNAASSSSACGYWPGRRRGSLPVDVYIGAGSCSSESESSAGDGSDT